MVTEARSSLCCIAETGIPGAPYRPARLRGTSGSTGCREGPGYIIKYSAIQAQSLAHSSNAIYLQVWELTSPCYWLMPLTVAEEPMCF